MSEKGTKTPDDWFSSFNFRGERNALGCRPGGLTIITFNVTQEHWDQIFNSAKPKVERPKEESI